MLILHAPTKVHYEKKNPGPRPPLWQCWPPLPPVTYHTLARRCFHQCLWYSILSTCTASPTIQQPSTTEFEEMVCKDFVGPGPYLTYPPPPSMISFALNCGFSALAHTRIIAWRSWPRRLPLSPSQSATHCLQGLSFSLALFSIHLAWARFKNVSLHYLLQPLKSVLWRCVHTLLSRYWLCTEQDFCHHCCCETMWVSETQSSPSHEEWQACTKARRMVSYASLSEYCEHVWLQVNINQMTMLWAYSCTWASR